MNAFARFLFQLIIGAPIVFVGIAICCGGIEEGLFLLFLSVICTFGLGLLIWIPLCWFIGWLLVTAFAGFTSKPD